jgi:hypothetical protein
VDGELRIERAEITEVPEVTVSTRSHEDTKGTKKTASVVRPALPADPSNRCLLRVLRDSVCSVLARGSVFFARSQSCSAASA